MMITKKRQKKHNHGRNRENKMKTTENNKYITPEYNYV